MKPVNFPEHNVIYAKDQPQYHLLPAYKTESGEVIFCWKLSIVERLRILWTGELWLSLLSFNKPLMPSFLTTKKSEIFAEKK